MVRCDSVMKNLKMDLFTKLNDDYATYQKRYDTSNTQLEHKILEKDMSDLKNQHWVEYSRSKMGSLASDRENLIRIQAVNYDDRVETFVYAIDDHPDCPKNTGAVRMEYWSALVTRQVGEDIHSTEFQQMDLKGYFPTMLMNQVMSKIILDRQNVTQIILAEIKNNG